MKTPENTEDDADVPEPADEGDIQMKYSSDLAVQPKYRSSNKKIPARTEVSICTA
jgi:hypothetical protein